MNKTKISNIYFFRLLVFTAGIILLIVSTLLVPPAPIKLGSVLLAAFFIAILSNFPLVLVDSKFSLINSVILGGGILYGGPGIGWACLLGILAGHILPQALPGHRKEQKPVGQAKWIAIGYEFGLNLIPLVVVLTIFEWQAGIGDQLLESNQPWSVVLTSGLLVGILHSVLFLSDVGLQHKPGRSRARRDFATLALLEILPVPLALLALLTFPALHLGTLAMLGFISTFIAIPLHNYDSARGYLDRRSQEFNALNQISQSLNSILDLENLLNAIHEQVTKLLGVDNFYVGLYDSGFHQIWYPLAVKHGHRQQWPRRPLMNRLTDRVILNREPILLAHHAREQLAQIGLPATEDAPYAWIGVPLIASDHAIGCLALFSISPDIEFTQDDLTLLTILSGQTSVAIEIALHNALLFTDITLGRDRLAAVLNSVGEGLALIETDGRITLANEVIASLTGLPQPDFIGKKLWEFPQPILQTFGFSHLEAENLIAQLIKGDAQLTAKVTFTLADQKPERFLERTLVPVLSQNSQVIGWVIVLRDITEEYQIRQAQDLIGETLIHDLRSPISAVLGALDVVGESIAGDDPGGMAQPAIGIARRSAQRVLGMVESLLEIARMQAGKIELNLTSAHLRTLVEHTLSEFAKQAAEYGINLQNEVPPDFPLITLDQNKILRVLGNLLDNAIKFTPEKGQIIISVALSPNNLVTIQVSDTGPGIPEEYRDKVFDRFSQVPGQVGRRRGSGLGLAYCRMAVEAHGGSIWVDSTPQGGSSFLFTLPLAGTS